MPRMSAITPADPVLRAEWKLLLSVIRDNKADLAYAPADWQLGPHKVGERNRLVLSEIRDRAVSTVTSELVRRFSRLTPDGLCAFRSGRARSIAVSGDWARIALYVPAKARAPVIEIHLEGTRRPLKLTTYVLPGVAPLVLRKATHAQTVSLLKERGFREDLQGNYKGWYAAHDRIAPSPEAATPGAAVWAQLEERLTAIVVSGTLDALVT